MPALAAVVAVAALTIRPSLAPRVPRMTAPVVNVRASKLHGGTSLPFVGRYVPRRISQALGSGVIVDGSGLILTNHHLIDGADQVTVALADGKSFKASVVGEDPDIDIALLRIEPSARLPAAPLGDSSRLRVGDFVVAVGNPFGLEHTVTSGIVSANARVLHEGPHAPLIQTDASINPGNSGGPLYDLDGNIVGINTAMVEGAHGIGFAVPINRVREALPELRTHHPH
jgi:serine protease Do